MSDSLAIKHGYYFEVDRNDEEKVFHVIIGKGYINDDVENFSVKMEDGFMVYYTNGKREAIRDEDLCNTFENVADAFLSKIADAYTKNALVKRVDGKLVSYYN